MVLKLLSEIPSGPASTISYKDALEFIENPRFTKCRALTKDIKSALNQWLKFNKLTLDSIIGDEFNKSFQGNIDLLQTHYPNKSTWHAIKSKIELCNKAYLQLLPPSIIRDDTFKDFLRFELRRKGWSQRELCRRTKIPNPVLSRWVNANRVPSSQKSLRYLQTLSETLGYQKEYIENNFVLTLKHQIRKKNQIGMTQAGIRTQKATAKVNRYGLTKNEWDSDLSLKQLKDSLDKNDPFYDVKREFSEYFHYKTKLNLRDDLEIEEYWKVDSKGKCTSAKVIIGKLKSYFGFLKNIEKRETFSLLDIFNTELLANYYDFWIEKHGSPTRTSVEFSSSVISPILAYYRNYPQKLKSLENSDIVKLKEKYDRYKPNVTWEQFLLENIQEVLSEIYRKTKGQSAKMQKLGVPDKLVDEKIEDWLKLDNPIEPIVAAIEDMKLDYQALLASRDTGTNKKQRISLLRDIVILDILLEKPIRSETMIQLRLGHELKFRNNLWTLDIPSQIVKNEKSIKYDCSEELSDWISKYNELHHEINSGNNLCKTLQSEVCSSLFGIVSTRLEKYTGRTINPHAFRKLRATHYIINFQDGYLYAAEILDDDIKTVLKEYAYLKNRRLGALDRANLESMRNKYRSNKKNIIKVLVNDVPVAMPLTDEKIITLLTEKPENYLEKISEIIKTL